MSVLSEITEPKALKIIANMVRQFEKLDKLKMTAIDEQCSRQAMLKLSEVVESSGK